MRGEPREKKRTSERPVVAALYGKYSPAIDIHNHIRQGRCALEDVFRTKNPHIRQFTGVMSFVFTNAFLAWQYFHCKKSISQLSVKDEAGSFKSVHGNFKLTLSN